jgi:type 1 glutamine amidotransferase
MNKFSAKIGLLFAVSLFLLVIVSDSYAKPKKLLVVTVTKGYKHQSIPVLEKIIEDLGKSSKRFTVDYARTDEDLALKMNAAALQDYDGVVFASTTGDLPLPDKNAFLSWIKDGGAFIGVHSATDTFHGYQPFIEMIGGEFLAHGPQLKVMLNVNDKKHSAVKDFGENYEIFDEIYTFKNFKRENVRVLISLDKNPNQNDKENFGKAGFYPISWCRKYGKGRVFYTALGHREDVLESEKFKKHLLGGINWTLRQAKGNSKPN